MATINNSYHNNRDKDFVKDKRDKKNGSGQELKEIYLQKFSAGLLAELAEAVIISGAPKFLVSRDDKISIESSIGLSDKLIKPPETKSYLSKTFRKKDRK